MSVLKLNKKIKIYAGFFMIPEWAYRARNCMCWVPRNWHAGTVEGTGASSKLPVQTAAGLLAGPGVRARQRCGDRLLTSRSGVTWRSPRTLGPGPSNTLFYFLFWHLSLVVVLLGQIWQGNVLPTSKRTPQTIRGGDRYRIVGRGRKEESWQHLFWHRLLLC